MAVRAALLSVAAPHSFPPTERSPHPTPPTAAGYLDFTDFVMTKAQQISFSGGFFLGGAQAVFAAQRPNDAVLGVSLAGNVWYDCAGPSLAVNESGGAYWGSVTDLDVSGTAFCGYSRTVATGLPTATRVLTNVAGLAGAATVAADFSGALLFPSAGIASVALAGNPFGVAAGGGADAGCGGFVSAPLPLPGQALQVHVTVPTRAAGVACADVAVTVTQSNFSTWSTQAVA